MPVAVLIVAQKIKLSNNLKALLIPNAKQTVFAVNHIYTISQRTKKVSMF